MLCVSLTKDNQRLSAPALDDDNDEELKSKWQIHIMMIIWEADWEEKDIANKVVIAVYVFYIQGARPQSVCHVSEMDARWTVSQE